MLSIVTSIAVLITFCDSSKSLPAIGSGHVPRIRLIGGLCGFNAGLRVSYSGTIREQLNCVKLWALASGVYQMYSMNEQSEIQKDMIENIGGFVAGYGLGYATGKMAEAEALTAGHGIRQGVRSLNRRPRSERSIGARIELPYDESSDSMDDAHTRT